MKKEKKLVKKKVPAKKKPAESLASLRKKIDKLDNQIIRLLDERIALAVKIGNIKDLKGAEVYAPDRESAIYYKLDQAKLKTLPTDSLKSIYREIMSASLSLERPLKISFLGPEASFTHLASLSKFGSSVNYVSCASITDVFLEVEKGQADYGIIPIENTTEGAVNHTLDMFIDSDLKVCSEIIFEISHCLMSNSRMQDIKRVYSNPQVFGQCRRWLETHLPRVQLIDTSTTAYAAKKASQEDGSAAMASKLASSLYNIKLLAEGVEDSPHNRTRFLVVARNFPKRSGHDKTSLLISLKDRVGALSSLLEPIRKRKINMTKIESRPSKKRAWDYYFFIDIMGHVEDAKIKNVLKEIESNVSFFKMLGSYPTIREKK